MLWYLCCSFAIHWTQANIFDQCFIQYEVLNHCRDQTVLNRIYFCKAFSVCLVLLVNKRANITCLLIWASLLSNCVLFRSVAPMQQLIGQLTMILDLKSLQFLIEYSYSMPNLICDLKMKTILDSYLIYFNFL